MTIQQDIELLATLDEKVAGHLIRHNDWNDLVGVVSRLATAVKPLVDANLIARVTDLETKVSTLTTSVIPNLEQRLQTVEESIAPLLQNYVMTLKTARQHYALGEVCEITVQVTDLQSAAVNPRPWVDFVCSWGTLRAASGFSSSLPGEGGNSLSVQVNSEGFAKVLLSSGPKGATAQHEMQVMAIMNNQVDGESYTVAEALLQSTTPGDARAKKAYKKMHKEYERKDSSIWRNYADKYGQTSDYRFSTGEWEYHYATVMAFARPDGNPVTPDGARASASVQVAFRNWVPAWGIDYVTDDDELVTELEVDWDRVIAITEEKPLDKLWHRVEEQVRDRGIWGRQKFWSAGERALGKTVGTGDPRQEVREQASKAIAAQAAADMSQMYGATSGSKQGAPVMAAYAVQGTRTDSVSQQVALVSAEASQARGLSESVAVLEGRMQSTEQLGMSIQGSLQLINENVRGINALDETSLKGGVQKISAEIAAIKTRLG